MRGVGIVGMGLIGGSLGLALRRLEDRVHVTAVTRTEADAEAATARGAADRSGTQLEGLRDCELVVVATPISQAARTFEQLGQVLPETTLITDVASVKQPILELARRLPSPGRFLGGHPMAGKTESGLRHGDPSLFAGSPWVFTPSEGQDPGPFGWWIDLVREIGAQPLLMSAREHDQRAAFVSHLAFTLSAAYAATVEANGGQAIAGPGFRSMTRLAAGDPRLYGDIVAANQGPLLQAIDRFTETLARYRQRIAAQDQLADLFAEADRARA
ncbi:MAG: prephenate dehydrogenase [Candidatus Dormibacter sp.]